MSEKKVKKPFQIKLDKGFCKTKSSGVDIGELIKFSQNQVTLEECEEICINDKLCRAATFDLISSECSGHKKIVLSKPKDGTEI